MDLGYGLLAIGHFYHCFLGIPTSVVACAIIVDIPDAQRLVYPKDPQEAPQSDALRRHRISLARGRQRWPTQTIDHSISQQQKIKWIIIVV